MKHFIGNSDTHFQMHHRIGIIVVLFFLSCISYGQESAEKDLKVGLVLSGGGAKGLAHIGALKVIEEAGVEIDYIGGTSMGAIVGGLYAAGYSAAELDSIFRNTDFADLIQDNLPRGAKSFYEKGASEKYALTLPFNNFKISFPPAYSGGQNIYNELVRILYHVKDINDFNRLSIPFVCIATNVETGEEVVLNKGYLPEAIMASGTLPSLFEPAALDDKILIDGGVVNNYPVKQVKKMGADIIIGVDVQHGLRDREALLSATEILLQINNYRTALDMVEKSKLTDIYIKPNIDKYSVVDFNSAKAIVDNGEIAAREQFGALQAISEKQHRSKGLVKYVAIKDTIMVKRLVLSGNRNYTSGYIRGKLRFELNKKITFEKLQQGISNLSATGNFKTIRYKLLSNDDGVDMILNLNENNNKTYIRLGAHYDDLYKTAAIINLTHRKLLMKDDVGSMDFIIGDNIRYNFHYFVDKGPYWSFGINSRYNNFSSDIDFDIIRTNFEIPNSDNVKNISLDVTDITNQIYAQTVLKEEFAVSLGLEHKFLKYSTRTLGEGLASEGALLPNSEPNKTVFEKSNYFGAFGGLTLDTYDDKYFPSKGIYFDGKFNFYFLSSDYNQNFKEFSVAKARMGGAFSILKNLSLNLETEGGFKLGTSSVTTFDFVLGGYGTDLINNFVPFFGYDFLSLPGNSFVKAYCRLDFEFAPKNHMLIVANIANVDDDLFRIGEWFEPPKYTGYGLGYGWESFFGPVQVFYSWSPEVRKSNFFFSIGYWF